MTTNGRDVIVIGGGITGIATAYYLAHAGIASTVIERDAIGSHASGFAYGGLSGGIPNGPQLNFPAIAEGMRLHRELALSLAAVSRQVCSTCLILRSQPRWWERSSGQPSSDLP